MTFLAILVAVAAQPSVVTYAEGCRLTSETGRPLVTFISRPPIAVPGCIIATAEPRAWWPAKSVVVSWRDASGEHVGRAIPSVEDAGVRAAVRAILNGDGVPLPDELIAALPPDSLPVGTPVAPMAPFANPWRPPVVVPPNMNQIIPWKVAPAFPFCLPGT